MENSSKGKKPVTLSKSTSSWSQSAPRIVRLRKPQGCDLELELRVEAVRVALALAVEEEERVAVHVAVVPAAVIAVEVEGELLGELEVEPELPEALAGLALVREAAGRRLARVVVDLRLGEGARPLAPRAVVAAAHAERRRVRRGPRRCPSGRGRRPARCGRGSRRSGSRRRTQRRSPDRRRRPARRSLRRCRSCRSARARSRAGPSRGAACGCGPRRPRRCRRRARSPGRARPRCDSTLSSGMKAQSGVRSWRARSRAGRRPAPASTSRCRRRC